MVAYISSRVWMNFAAIVISLIAVVYWVRLYGQLYKKDKREIRGWRWLFTAVLAILIFNITSTYVLSFVGNQTVWIDISKVFPNSRLKAVVMDMGVMELVDTLGRTVIGISLTVGGYLLYSPMRRSKGAQYRFVPVNPVIEKSMDGELKYNLRMSSTYLIKEDSSIEGSRDLLIKSGGPAKSLQVFMDYVTHGIPGLVISRTHPQKIREKYGLVKVPVLWLSESTEYRGSIRPTDLLELGQTIKEFIEKSENSVVLLDGMEYLITRNNFEEVLHFIQSLNDTISLSKTRLLLPINPTTIDEKQLHLLEREIPEVTSVWKG